MQGKVLVFAANAIIFATLAIMGLLLSAWLAQQAAECDQEEPNARCERTAVTAESSRGVALALGAAAIVLAFVAAWLHRRAQRSV